MSAPENLPAFPEVPGDFNAYEGRSGMTLRDWFAGQALIGRVQNGYVSSADKTVHARKAYEIADAMLAERSKP